ncbi:uncharacterized protein LOC104692108 [Corvus cornix cornix]|uniref:uncharacterized protein LOC104692108 n=1 Tax=Corvus cornix cornix TaxID=932674 RepID=UPI0019517702|nr:uncharacterized protein LOC104692108 [Corvus cornix cornix]
MIGLDDFRGFFQPERFHQVCWMLHKVKGAFAEQKVLQRKCDLDPNGHCVRRAEPQTFSDSQRWRRKVKLNLSQILPQFSWHRKHLWVYPATKAFLMFKGFYFLLHFLEGWVLTPTRDSRPALCKAPWKHHWLPSPIRAGSLESPEAGSAPHCSAKHQELASRALLHCPPSLGTPRHIWSVDQGLFASPACALGFLSLQELDAPGHASAPHAIGRGSVSLSNRASHGKEQKSEPWVPLPRSLSFPQHRPCCGQAWRQVPHSRPEDVIPK